MKTSLQIITRIFNFYVEGFRNMTWGRTLWIIILIKLFIMFAILRFFFFQPVLGGMEDTEKQEVVANKLLVR